MGFYTKHRPLHKTWAFDNFLIFKFGIVQQMDFDACFLSLCLIKFRIIIDFPQYEQFTYSLSAVGGFPAVLLSMGNHS